MPLGKRNLFRKWGYPRLPPLIILFAENLLHTSVPALPTARTPANEALFFSPSNAGRDASPSTGFRASGHDGQSALRASGPNTSTQDPIRGPVAALI